MLVQAFIVSSLGSLGSRIAAGDDWSIQDELLSVCGSRWAAKEPGCLVSRQLCNLRVGIARVVCCGRSSSLEQMSSGAMNAREPVRAPTPLARDLGTVGRHCPSLPVLDKVPFHVANHQDIEMRSLQASDDCSYACLYSDKSANALFEALARTFLCAVQPLFDAAAVPGPVGRLDRTSWACHPPTPVGAFPPRTTTTIKFHPPCS